MIKIENRCLDCGGVGTKPTSDTNATPIACTACEGTGYKEVGSIDASDIEDKFNDILDKCNDIFEKVSE